MMAQELDLDPASNAPNFLDREIYSLSWKPAPDEFPDFSGLPSFSHALYLFHTVQYHLGQCYRILDETAFISGMHEFYHGNAIEKVTKSRLWFVQFLLVQAFGKAFLSQSKSSKDPPGSQFFLRAMSIMPHHATIWRDSLLAIEVFALIGLYWYAIDHRESAHVYVSTIDIHLL
jgi:proline utilization trans-activator